MSYEYPTLSTLPPLHYPSGPRMVLPPISQVWPPVSSATIHCPFDSSGAAVAPYSQEFGPAQPEHHAPPPFPNTCIPPPQFNLCMNLLPCENVPAAPPALTKSHPKPTPHFLLLDDDDKENLPEATVSAILGSKASGRTVKQGGRVGSTVRGRGKGGAASIKGPPKRKRLAVDDESDDEGVAVKKGWALGAVKWLEVDYEVLLDLAEERLPARKKEWLALYQDFETWVAENSRPKRSADTIEKQYKALVCMTKPTDHTECLREVERAHAIEHLISNWVASGVICNDDLDEEVIENSLDDVPQKPAAPKSQSYIARHVKVEPPPDSRACTSAVQLRGMLQNVVATLDPAVRDEWMQHRHDESLHMQTLITQLQDALGESRTLCKELQMVQRELDRESRQADNAERDLCMFQMLHGGHHLSHYTHSTPSDTQSSCRSSFASPSFGRPKGDPMWVPAPELTTPGPSGVSQEEFGNIDVPIDWPLTPGRAPISALE
ncbi:hypothetical protein K439DRAFT_1621113 [Ramaria rubella]|nr:hypothetical protein K439DRAFT_1621113 [Ramaria rubella]